MRDNGPVSITTAQEQQFYDAAYSAHLHTSDDDLRTNRESILRDLHEPAGAFYERRKLYSAVLSELLSQPLAGIAALDYGCGVGEWGVLMATEGARVTLLDLSPVAIEVGLRRAAANGVAHMVRGYARDASDLTCFADREFDLIYASAALHHTLKYPNALAELLRVLRPGGRLILAETYGNNPILNGMRRLRWRFSRQPDEAGEEIILGDREIAMLRSHFTRLAVTPMNLLAMAKRLFRGRFGLPPVRATMGLLEAVDLRLLRFLPALRRYCGEALVVAEK